MNEHIDALWTRRNQYASADTQRKLDALDALRGFVPTSARPLRRLHDTLLFLIAHPDSAEVHRVATRRLADLTQNLEMRFRAEGPLEALTDSGIVGAPVSVEFCFDGVQNLSRAYPADVAIDWEDEQTAAGIDRLLPVIVSDAERDGLSDMRLTTDEWVSVTAGAHPGADVAWLVNRLQTTIPDPRVRDWVWDRAHICIRWTPTTVDACRSGSGLLPRSAYTLSRGRKTTVSVTRELRRPVPRPRPLSPRRAEVVIAAVRANLYSRQRETDAVTFANPQEVLRFPLERGLDVYVFGLAPGRRLPVESFFGYVATRNGLPVAYGGGWVFFDRCEIGANVLEEFRGGESLWVFTQVLRVYGHVFRPSHFKVHPYQIGDDNDEAIRSGAFWFYYRLGFRPTDDALRSKAEEEFARIGRDRSKRTPARLLRRFAASPLVLASEFEPMTDTLSLAHLSTETMRLGAAETQAASARRVARALGIEDLRTRSTDERMAFERLSPLVSWIPNLASWPRADKRALARCLFAKGGPRELDYALGLRRLPRLMRAFADITDVTDG